MKKIILVLFLIPIYSFSISIPDKYPSYAYVFAEFDVDESYAYDTGFEMFVEHNEKKIKSFYKHSLSNGKDILPMMKGYLMDNELSDLFIYLSMIESGFSPDIMSSKKAVGLWQFMPATAKNYHMSVGNSFDERCDPVSSTNAAINYLSKLHRQFGKWYLAAMAYNCGEGRLEKAIKKAGSDELSILVDDRHKYLPLETREYIKKILLVAMIGESTTLDFASAQSLAAEKLLQVEVPCGTKLRELAKLIDMKPSRLLTLNRQFKNAIVPMKNSVYKITIPEEKMINFYLRNEVSEEKERVKPYFISHYVHLGDTLESIAKQYKTDSEEITIANRLEDEYLTLGQFLIIPVSEDIFKNNLLN